jgi:methyl-accepting chemotaxis protein
MKKVNDSYKDLLNYYSVRANIKDMTKNTLRQTNSLRDYLLNPNDDTYKNLQKDNTNFNTLTSKTAVMDDNNDEKNTLQKLIESNQEFMKKSDQAVELAKTNKAKAVDYFSKEIVPFVQQIQTDEGNVEDPQQNKNAVIEKKNDANNTANFINKFIMIISVAGFLLSIAVGVLISRLISKPVVMMVGIANKIATGDLTAEEINVKNRDEIGDLAKAFNRMSQNLRNLIQKVGFHAEQVAASAEELTASSEQTSEATKHVAKSIEEIATSSEQQSQTVEETLQTVNTMAGSIEQISASAQEVSVSSKQATALAQEGNEAVQLAVAEISAISNTVNELNDTVNRLGVHSQAIEQIVGVITTIAGQTNLLALNAAIEAARAGEHGRGFAVVAGEVRKLAEQSRSSAEEIAQLIAIIKTEIQEVIKDTEKGTKEVASGIHAVQIAGTSFEQIQAAVSGVAGQMEEVSSAMLQLAANSGQMVKTMDVIASATEIAASGTQTVSAATEEQLATMEEISTSSNALSKMAEELHALIVQFKV